MPSIFRITNNLKSLFKIKSFNIFIFSVFVVLTLAIAFNSINPSAKESKTTEATAVNLISDFIINNKSFTSQGSGEVVGEYLYTTGHNFTSDQVVFLTQNGSKFLSIKGSCSRIIGANTSLYSEGVLQIPLSLFDTKSAQKIGLKMPTTLKNNPTVEFINWYSDYLNPNYVYVRGVTKNQNGKKEQILTGSKMFNSNGTGLSGGGYKYNSDLSTIDSDSKQSYLLGIHIGAATYEGEKINIMWVSNGDGTFSYARYLPTGRLIRVDNLLNSECNL